MLVILYWWLSKDFDKAKKACLEPIKTIFLQVGTWWQLALGLLILAVAWGLVAANILHTTFGRNNYLIESGTLNFSEHGMAQDRFPSPDTTMTRRQEEQFTFSTWQDWMVQAVDGTKGRLLYVESIEFQDDFADLVAKLRVATEYRIVKAVASLEYDRPRFTNGPMYHPRWRQMRTWTLQDGDALLLGVGAPNKNERLLVFLHVDRDDGTPSIDIDQCFPNKHFEVQ